MNEERDAYADEIHAERILENEEECFEVTGLYIRSNNSIFAERHKIRLHLTRSDAKTLTTYLSYSLKKEEKSP